MSLDSRERVPELMDDPALDPAEHRRALDGLARLNAASGAAARLWNPIAELARRSGGRPIRLLDVATGSGDVPIELARWAARAGFPLEVTGCDLSPMALGVAAEMATAAGVRATFVRHDVLADPLPGGFDVVTCSLFLHHLSDADAATVLRRMAGAAERLVLVNDLARSRLNYGLVWLGCRLLSRSPVVRFDGPASVRAAFTPAEMLALAERAGLRGAKVATRFPCRLLLSWSKA